MIHLQEYGLKHYVVICLLLLLLVTRIFRKKQWVIKYKDNISIFIFIVLAIIVGIEFWTTKIYIGLVALVLGSIAIGKYFYDKKKRD
jgi:hypothetical protein